MTLKTAQQWSGLIVCKDTTGALATPSAGPVGALYVNGIVNGAGVSFSGANPYKWTVTLPALAAGDIVSLYVTATIATIPTASVVSEEVADTNRISDIDIEATGEVGLNFDNVKNAASAHTLSNITIPIVTDVTNGVDLIASLKHVAGVAGYDRTTDSLEAIGSKVTNLPTDPADESLLEAAIEAAAHEVTVVASVAVSSTVAAAVSTGSMTIESGYTFRQSVVSTLTDDISAATKLWLAIKQNTNQVDSSSVIFIEKTSGLTILLGNPYSTVAHGSLVVSGSSGAWNIAVYIGEIVTALLLGSNSEYYVGIKAKIGSDTFSVWEGNCFITDGIVHTTS